MLVKIMRFANGIALIAKTEKDLNKIMITKIQR